MDASTSSRYPPAQQPAVDATAIQPADVIVHDHSSLFYWWPVWLTGFVMSAIIYWGGDTITYRENELRFYAASNLGVIYLLVVFVVILITNLTVRGLGSALVIMGAITITVVLAFFGLWDPIFDWFGDLRIYLNLGAYFWFSVVLFLAWAIVFFVVDRFSYWRITAGQVTHHKVMGAASRTFDTENLVLEKRRDDLFRHWILGLGTGDLVLRPYGAQRDVIELRNVLFVGSKIVAIQRLIAKEPASRVNVI